MVGSTSVTDGVTRYRFHVLPPLYRPTWHGDRMATHRDADLYQIKNLILRFIEKYPSAELRETRALTGPMAHLLLKSRIMIDACKLAMDLSGEFGIASQAHLAEYKRGDGQN